MSVRVQRGTSATNARRSKYHGLLFRPLLDAAIAGIAFTLVTGVVCTHAKAGIMPPSIGAAHAIQATPVVKAVAEPGPLPLVRIATASSPADAVFRQTSATAAWVLLGIAFSLMTALNMAMVRHLKRAYAVPVRRLPTEK